MKYFTVAIVLFLFLGIIAYFLPQYSAKKVQPDAPKLFYEDYALKPVLIGSQTYSLYLADTEDKRTQGLSEVQKMNSNDGLAFIFDTSDRYSFWMKDMHFPLDIIFVNNGKVVDIFEAVKPDTYPQTFTPSQQANLVIELNAGEVKHSGIKIGDEIRLK